MAPSQSPHAKKQPVTEVESAEEIAKLRWWEQGDKSLETAHMLETRFANRRAPAVVRELNSWWDAALRGSFAKGVTRTDGVSNPPSRAASPTPASDGDPPPIALSIDPSLDKKRYTAIFTKIGLALSEEDEGHDIEEARQNADEAWVDDARGGKELSRKRWLDTLFELADTVRCSQWNTPLLTSPIHCETLLLASTPPRTSLPMPALDACS